MLNVPLEDRFDETFPGGNFTPDETEFILAIDRYKSATGRRFISWHEVLRIVQSLGYRRTQSDAALAEGVD